MQMLLRDLEGTYERFQKTDLKKSWELFIDSKPLLYSNPGKKKNQNPNQTNKKAQQKDHL